MNVENMARIACAIDQLKPEQLALFAELVEAGCYEPEVNVIPLRSPARPELSYPPNDPASVPGLCKA